MRYRIFLLLIVMYPSLGLCQNATVEINTTKNDSLKNWKKTKVNRLRHAFYYKKDGHRPKTISFITGTQDKISLINFWKKNKTNSHLRISLGLLEENRNSVKRLKPNLVLFAEMFDSINYNDNKTPLYNLELFDSDIFPYLEELMKGKEAFTDAQNLDIEDANNQLNAWRNTQKSKMKDKINMNRGKLIYLTFNCKSTTEIFSKILADLNKKEEKDLLFHFGIDDTIEQNEIQFKVIAHVEKKENINGESFLPLSPFFNFASACPCYCPNISPPPCQE